MTTPIEKAAEALTLYLFQPNGHDEVARAALTAALGSVEETARVLADADSHTLARHDVHCAFCTGYRNQAEALHAHLLAEPETKEGR